MSNITDQINIRVDHQLKIGVEAVLHELGIKTSDAIRMFLTQVYLTKSMPIELKLPNEKTIAAIVDGEHGNTTRTDLASLENMFENL